MKAECPQCGGLVALAQWPEKGTLVTCHECSTTFDATTSLKFEFGEVHVTEEEETFVVEWQVRS